MKQRLSTELSNVIAGEYGNFLAALGTRLFPSVVTNQLANAVHFSVLLHCVVVEAQGSELTAE